jgi:hypothetical protein
MNPDVVFAIDELTRAGTLERKTAVVLRRAASGSLVSVHAELRVLLWLGVLLITTGVGVLVRQNLDRIGPVAIAVAIGVAAAGCLAWVWRRPPESTFAFESVLLLGALLAAADLAFIELKFTPLGAQWPWHLLIVAIGYAALALRFDSTSLFSLALTSLAAWRGVSIVFLAAPWDRAAGSDRLFAEALVCGVVFLAIAKLTESMRFHPRFEPVAAWLGWLVIFGALWVRLDVDEGRLVVATMLVACGAILAVFAWDERRIGRYALGVGAAAVGVGGWAFHLIRRAQGSEDAYLAAIVALAAAVVVLLLRAQRAVRGRT